MDAAPLRIGSLCTGYGGLEMAIEMLYDADVAWCADNDPRAATVLATRWPHVPNLGDLLDLDWTTVPKVDLVAAGFPCQDISFAGRGAGIRKDTRSGLWITIASSLRLLRPAYVFLENVAALRTRGLPQVLGDLAALGYDTAWMCLRASDIGAPHRRDRIFLLAARSDRQIQLLPGPGTGAPGRTQDRPGRGGQLPPAANSGGMQSQRQRTRGELAGTRPQAVPQPLDAAQHRDPAAPHAGGQRHQSWHRDDPGSRGRPGPAPGASQEWGDYEPAIRRWEQLLGRPAPHPTEPGRTGHPRLSARFVEWMMGLPGGHVTGLPLSRQAQLQILGNGVVPQQAACALSLLTAALAGTEAR
ncbi:DNA (cytosine-5-)-methyltransferase [Spirillospora sp. NPDC052269]